MIEKEIAKKQVARLGQMLRYPKDQPTALAELVIAFQAANSQSLAEACAQNFLDTARADTPCPMPAEVRGWIYERQEAEETEAKQRTAACAECGGTGWKRRYSKLYSGVEVCTCRKGASA